MFRLSASIAGTSWFVGCLTLLGLSSEPEARTPHPSSAIAVADPAQRLEVWTERRRRGRRELEDEDEQELRELLGDLRVWESAAPARRIEAADALLELAVVDADWPRRDELRGLPPGEGPEPGRIGTIGYEALEQRMAGIGGKLLTDHFAREVVGSERSRHVQRVALELMAGRYLRGTEGVLLATARGSDDTLARTALEALAGWPRPEMHFFFLEELERGETSTQLIARHFDLAKGTLGPAALDELRSQLGRMYLSEDWRNAARARRLLPALDARRAVPLLIEALTVWHRRTVAGEGSRRIQHEVVVELQRLSGRTIGVHPQRWNRWWTAVRDGRIDLPEEDQEGANYSRASFFGLQPVSDKVVFVVDNSGSMGWRFGTADRSRYTEAMDQLFRYLEKSGEETHFGLVLFSDRAISWRRELREALPGNLDQARTWLRRNGPNGGTMLRAGVEEALGAERDGMPDLERLEADTVVVLCDGATAEGPDWVETWLETVNEGAQIRFYCVQIGAGGDGTLEALSGGSGGEFVRVSG